MNMDLWWADVRKRLISHHKIKPRTATLAIKKERAWYQKHECEELLTHWEISNTAKSVAAHIRNKTLDED